MPIWKYFSVFTVGWLYSCLLGDHVDPACSPWGTCLQPSLSPSPALPASCFWNIWSAWCPAMNGHCG